MGMSTSPPLNRAGGTFRVTEDPANVVVKFVNAARATVR
jgi:hypothetical protein